MAAEKNIDLNGVEPVVSESENALGSPRRQSVEERKKPWYYAFAVWGSAPQIILAALLALAIGLPLSMKVDDIPKEVPVYLNIPGDLWLRSLKAIGKSLPIFIFNSSVHPDS